MTKPMKQYEFILRPPEETCGLMLTSITIPAYTKKQAIAYFRLKHGMEYTNIIKHVKPIEAKVKE